MDTATPRSVVESADEAVLWRLWIERADIHARSTLIQAYLPFVKSIAMSVYRTANPNYVDLRDLVQLGSVGLIEAVSRFDPRREIDFRGFAATRIRGSILNGLQDLSELHAQQAFRSRVRKERVQALRQKASANDKPRDLFAEMVELALGLAIGYMLDGTGLYANDAQSSVGYTDGTEVLIASNAFAALVEQLPEAHRRVIDYHYRGGMDFAGIAKLLDVTKGRVSQIHRSALDTLRANYKGRAKVDLKA